MARHSRLVVPLWTWFAALGLLPALAGISNAQVQLAIKGGRILPVVGEPIEEGVILIEGNRIKAVGADLEVPIEAQVIDAGGKVVLPGFVEVHTSGGLSQANEVNPNVPFISVIDAIDPSQDFFEDARRDGVTSACIAPGNSTMVGGQAAVVKTAGTYVDDMILKRDVALKISLRPASGRSRMSHLARLRAELEETRRYIEDREGKADESAEDEDEAAEEEADEEEAEEDGDSARAQDDDEPEEDEEEGEDNASEEDEFDILREAMVRLLEGELPTLIYCPEALDVPQALRLIDEYDLDATLILGPSCHKAIDLIAERERPVILDPELVFWETDPRTDEDRRIVLPRIYRQAGVPILFQTGGGALGRNFLWYQAATAVKYGMPFEEALEALTIRPARVLGVEDSVGSIEPGKDADLVILSGEPLQLGTWVETTIIDGEVVYRQEEDQKLQELLRPSAD